MFMCVCSTFRSSDFFYYSSKTDSWGRSLKVTAPRGNHAVGCCFSAPLKQRQLLLMNTPLSQCHEWPTSDGVRCDLRGALKSTPPKLARSVSDHMAAENSTLFSLNIGDSLTNNAWGIGRWEGGSKEGWVEGGTAQEEGWREGGSYKGWREKGDGGEGGNKEGEWEGESKGREVGSDDARQTESVSGGREG